MKIFLNIEAETAHELSAALADLAAKIGSVNTAAPPVAEPQVQADSTGNPPPAAEEPKKTRGKAKAPDAKPVEEAKDKPKADWADDSNAQAALAEVSEGNDEPPAITPEEVRNQIIDLLNDWSEAAPADTEIRVKTLKPILTALDAEKIGAIDPSKYHLVPGLVDDSRAALAEFKDQRSVEE